MSLSTSARSLACSRARVTTTPLPRSGFFSNQASFDAREHTPPTTMMLGAANLRFSASAAHVFQGGHQGLLGAARAPANERHGRVLAAAPGHEVARDHGQVLHAHVEHQRAVALGVDLPVVAALLLGGVLVPGDEADARGVVAVGHRDARIGRGGHAGRDAGHHLEGDARLHQLLGLLAAAAEDVRVAALQAGHALAGAGLVDDELVDLVLGRVWSPPFLPT